MVSKKRIHSLLNRSFKTNSEEETFALGEKLGKELHAGAVVALAGELGSGKTVLIKGIAKGLGVKDSNEVKSPTFVIQHQYEGRVPIYHFDLYRLENVKELDAIGFDDFLYDPHTISLIEWADRAKKMIPKNAIWAHLKVVDSRSRQIKL